MSSPSHGKPNVHPAFVMPSHSTSVFGSSQSKQLTAKSRLTVAAPRPIVAVVSARGEPSDSADTLKKSRNSKTSQSAHARIVEIEEQLKLAMRRAQTLEHKKELRREVSRSRHHD